jgi:hypothetical protein
VTRGGISAFVHSDFVVSTEPISAEDSGLYNLCAL